MSDRETHKQIAAQWAKSQPGIFAFISSIIPNFADVEDKLQTVAATVVEKADQYDASQAFAGWAIGIARIEIRRFGRHRATKGQIYITDAMPDLAVAFDELTSELDE